MNIFDEIQKLNLEPIALGEIYKDTLILHVYKPENETVVRVSKASTQAFKSIKIQSLKAIYSTYPVDHDGSATYNIKREYPEHEFYYLPKEVFPEYFL